MSAVLQSGWSLDFDGLDVIINEYDLHAGQHLLTEECALLGQATLCMPQNDMDWAGLESCSVRQQFIGWHDDEQTPAEVAPGQCGDRLLEQ